MAKTTHVRVPEKTLTTCIHRLTEALEVSNRIRADFLEVPKDTITPYKPDAGALKAISDAPSVGAEQQARQIAEASFRLASVAAELRDRIMFGGAVPKEVAGQNQGTPSEGPIKDALNATGFHLDCTFGCLDDISRYIGQ
jgi:hypothetical protein